MSQFSLEFVSNVTPPFYILATKFHPIGISNFFATEAKILLTFEFFFQYLKIFDATTFLNFFYKIVKKRGLVKKLIEKRILNNWLL